MARPPRILAYLGAPEAHVATASTADVMLMRLTLSLMNRPRITTVLSFICGRLNSLVPIRRNVFLPAGAAFGMSSPCAWLARLGVGSVAETSIQFVPCSRRQPVTLTISTVFFGGGACAEKSVATDNTERIAVNTPRIITRLPRILLAAAFILWATHFSSAHEAERTKVTLSLSADGRFDLTVANDPMWLLLRLETFAGGSVAPDITPAQRDARLAQLTAVFADRIVLFVDQHEVRAGEVFYNAPGNGERGTDALASFTLRGAMPRDATRLRWLYGLVGDRYPLEIKQPDGSSTIEWIDGTNWSDVIDLSKSFTRPTRLEIMQQYLWLGYAHILPKGLDHILFVLGLFLLSPRARPLLLQVTTFTIAHSITLGLSIYGLVTLPSSIVEPLIALSIAYVAIENLITRELKPWRLALVFMFGLLHGLGFAGVLRELGLPRGEFLTALVTFNVGVEAGQLTVIAAAWLATAPFMKKGWYHQRVVIPASLLIALVGIYWTITRVISSQ